MAHASGSRYLWSQMNSYDDEKFEEINPEFYLNDEDLAPEEAVEELDELSQQFVEKLIDKIFREKILS